MRKNVLLFVLAFAATFTAAGQKKANGTVFIEHPSLNVINEFVKATISGDSAKIASFLTDDFKSYNGTAINYESSTGKKAFVNNALQYSRELDYFTIETFPGSYPDAIEYKLVENKKENTDNEVWVQTWSLIKGVHKATGVKIDAGAHRLYSLTKDNKIKSIVNYSNSKVLDEIGASFANRTNGKIYNHHDYINTVRKAMYAYEKGDLDKSMSYYSDDVRFVDINEPYGTSRTKAEEKAGWQKFLTEFEIKSIDMIGYPDYLEYEMDNGREVLSWWKFNLVRKADKKAITISFHFSNSFDENGKIVSEVAYYGKGLLRQ
ncbi:MAG TPA: nuclear transport factor 2 family protein [Ferruginibacter sp.]|nr:nuclear transport factor 2 family protein [Ferruginibacter sp.]HMP22125.1 nuclear transport factor 2 family protein [Ferruginibacter sp.]